MPIANRTRTTPATRTTNRVPRRGGGRSGGKRGSNTTWMWWVGGIVLSLLITGVVKFSGKSSDDKQVRKEMIVFVQNFHDYDQNSSYYTQLVDRYHHEAFEAAYSMGARRTSAKLDVKLYLIQISSRMAAKASADGKSSVAETLSTFNEALRTK